MYDWNTENGSILLLSLPLLCALLLLLLGSIRLTLHLQERIAVQSRLDICATNMANQEIKLLKSLSEHNRWITGLSKAIVALRLGNLVLGPLAAAASSLGAEGMRDLIALHVGAQETAILLYRSSFLKKMSCPKTMASQTTALCLASPALLLRRSGLMPDLPGPMRWQNYGDSILCSSPSFPKIFTKLKIFGDPMLENNDYQYKY